MSSRSSASSSAQRLGGSQAAPHEHDHRAIRPGGESALTNLPRLAEVPLHTELGRPLEGCPAFIDSAGPSLDRNVHLLPEAAMRGVVFAVNTAAPCVIGQDVSIDVLVSIEVLDLSESLRKTVQHSHVLALDLSANPESWKVEPERRVGFMPASDPFHTLAESLGTSTLDFGASVATAAFALARAWGAGPIVLLGQDLGYTGGKVYATGTGREHTRAIDRGKVVTVEHAQSMVDDFERSGVNIPSEHQPALRVPAWGGEGQVVPTHGMVMFLRWFEQAAHQMNGRCRLVNATEGGASIAGFEEVALGSLLESLPERKDTLLEAAASARPLTEDRIAGLREEVARNARAVARAASERMRARKPKKIMRAERDLIRARKRSKYVEVTAAPTLFALRGEKSPSDDERVARTCRALEESARKVARLVV